MTGFYDVGPLGEVAVNLFHGYGYNFYRLENQLRADDQRVRALACDLLTQAKASLDKAESGYRHDHIPPPSRANPFPDPAAVAGAQVLERLARTIGLIEGQVRNQAVPENDRMSQRYRQEAATLEALADKDKVLIGQAELLRQILAGQSGDAVLQQIEEIEQGLAAIEATLRERRLILA